MNTSFYKEFISTRILKRFIMLKPLIAVLGATGAGKSKLALDIGQHIDGEIINADAMQMYKGLDIVTNKVSAEEIKLCPHHIIDFLSPSEQYTIVDFQHQALKKIQEIHDRNKIPILVGGTNYYIESILWDTLIQSKTDIDQTSNLNKSGDEIRNKLYEMSEFELHQRLQEVDPRLACTTHPKDKRKVIRGLEVYYQSGRPMSEHLCKQRTKSGGSNIGGPLRFPEACVLWVQCDTDVLQERVNRRVDKMIDRGLLQELADFHAKYNKERFEANLDREYERGIFQSIGFKEFHDYLTNPDAPESERTRLGAQGVERMKISTWQYAKYQQKWIKKRIVNRPVTVPVYPLNASDPSQWNDNVLSPALGIIRSCFSTSPTIVSKLETYHIEASRLPQPIEKTENRTSDDQTLKKCSVCGLLIRAFNWQDHLKSKKHKRTYGLLKKEQSATVRILMQREKQLTKTIELKQVELNELDFKMFNENVKL